MLNIRTLTPELQEIAINELFEEPEKIEENLEAFREWIQKSRHISSRTDDQFLIAFLRGCKYRTETVQRKFDLYHTMKAGLPKLTRNRDPLDERVLAVIRQGVCIALPKPTPDSTFYVLVRPGALDLAKNNASDFIKTYTMFMDLMIVEDDNFVIAGQVVVVDCTGLTVSHAVQYGPGFLKKILKLTQDSVPIRQKGQHFVNMPWIAMTLLKMFSSFLSEKLRKRIFVHDNDKSLLNAVPLEVLPTELGGKAGTIEDLIKEHERLLVANRDFFLNDEEFGVVEEKLLNE